MLVSHVWRQTLYEELPFSALSAAFVLAIEARGHRLSAVHQSGPTASLARMPWPLVLPRQDLLAARSLGRVPVPRHLDWRTLPVRPGHRGDGRDQPPGLCPETLLPGSAGLLALLRGHPGPEFGPGPRQRPARGRSLRLPLDDRLGGAYSRADGVGVAALGGAGGIAVAVTALVDMGRDPVCGQEQWRDRRDSADAVDTSAHPRRRRAPPAYNLGLVLQRQGRFAAAAAHYLESLRLDPDDAEAQNNLGVVLQRQGKLEAAAAHYFEALRLKPHSVDAHYNLGTVLSRQGKFAEAEARYTEALRLRPGFALAYNNLGADLFRQGRFVEAAARFAQALRIDPGARTHTTTWAWPSIAWGTMTKQRPIRRGGADRSRLRRGAEESGRSRSPPPPQPRPGTAK